MLAHHSTAYFDNQQTLIIKKEEILTCLMVSYVNDSKQFDVGLFAERNGRDTVTYFRAPSLTTHVIEVDYDPPLQSHWNTVYSALLW